MSAFWIFAACLTAAYAVYYTVVVTVDLLRKPAEDGTPAVETFDVGELPPVTTKTVEETDDGFRVAKEGADGQDAGWDETTLRPASPEAATPPPPPPGPKFDAHGVPTAAEQKISDVGKKMEETEPGQSSEMMAITMQTAICYGRPPVEIDKTRISTRKPSEAAKDKEVENDASKHV